MIDDSSTPGWPLFTLPNQRSGATRAADARLWAIPVITALLGIFLVCSVLRALTPDFPRPGLDPSWVAVVSEKALERVQWGVDIAFTFGPAAPLYTRFFTDQYLWVTLPLLVVIGIIYALVLTCLILSGPEREGIRPLATIAALLLLGAGLLLNMGNADAVHYAMALALFLLAMRENGERVQDRVALLLGAAVLGLMALSKLSFGLAALPLLVIADVRAVLLRRLPALTGTFVVAFLAAYLAYGQRLGALPDYLAAQLASVGGYSEAMSLPGPLLESGAYLVVAGLLLALILLLEARHGATRADRLTGLGVFLGVALYALVTFKAGFVRHDTHSLIAWSSLGLGILLYGLSRLHRFPVRTAGPFAVAGCLVVGIIPPLSWALQTQQPQDVPRAVTAVISSLLVDLPAGDLARLATFIRDPGRSVEEFKAARERGWQEVRDNMPLPKLEGTVDVIPSFQSTVMAHGLAYTPRPSFQDYATYSPRLMELKRAFIQSARAPDWLLFTPGAIDHRFPAFTEGQLWPDFLGRYEPVRDAGPLLGLRRRARPLGDLLGPPEVQEARFGEVAPIRVGGAVFARVEVEKTLLGRLAGLLFRPSILSMTLQLRNGQQETYRFIPAFGAAGFLLSPAVRSNAEFSTVALGQADMISDREVVGLRIHGHESWLDNASAKLLYKDAVRLELRPLRQELLQAPTEQSGGFRGAILGRANVSRLADWSGVPRDSLPIQDGRLIAHAPKRLRAPTVGASQVRVKYGIFEGAWAPGGTDGVCFAVRAGSEAVWERCLRPVTVEADRSEKEAVVDLPPGTGEVTLETSCIETCGWDWSYWSHLEPIHAVSR